VFGALNRARDKIAFVQARYEEMAALMASAYAKFSGKLAFALLGADRQGRVDLYRVDRR
jgi:pyruvate dehydrogenase (quinone)